MNLLRLCNWLYYGDEGEEVVKVTGTFLTIELGGGWAGYFSNLLLSV